MPPGGKSLPGGAQEECFNYIFLILIFSDRYEKSTTSRSLTDYNELKSLIDSNTAEIPSIFDDAKHPLPEIQALIAAGWPKKKDRLGRAILAIALKNGGLDLADGSTISRENIAKREYHHVFPHAYLNRKSISENKIFCSLNCALVTWHTNRNISDKNPEQYLAERREGTDLSESQLQTRLSSHLIPYEPLQGGDFEKYLYARAQLIQEAMRAQCN